MRFVKLPAKSVRSSICKCISTMCGSLVSAPLEQVGPSRQPRTSGIGSEEGPGFAAFPLAIRAIFFCKVRLAVGTVLAEGSKSGVAHEVSGQEIRRPLAKCREPPPSEAGSRSRPTTPACAQPETRHARPRRTGHAGCHPWNWLEIDLDDNLAVAPDPTDCQVDRVRCVLRQRAGRPQRVNS